MREEGAENLICAEHREKGCLVCWPEWDYPSPPETPAPTCQTAIIERGGPSSPSRKDDLIIYAVTLLIGETLS